MNDRGRAVVAELQQDELPSLNRVHDKADVPRRRGRDEEKERGSQSDLSHRPVPIRIKRKENKHRSSSQSSSRGITPDPHVKRFNPQTDGLAALYHCLIRLYKISSDGTITWNDLRCLYRKDVGRSFNTEELNLICGTTRRTKHQLLQTKLHKLIEPMDTKGQILRIAHTEDGVPVPLPSPISSDDDASSTLSRMTSTEDEELSKLSMEERRRELTESLIKQGLLKKNGGRMSASFAEDDDRDDSPVEETEASIHVEKADESEGSETEVRERVFNSLMKNFAQMEELEKALEETDAIQERLTKTLAETNEVEAHIEATRRSPSPTACHTIEEEETEDAGTLSPRRSSSKNRKRNKKVSDFVISEEPEEIAEPVKTIDDPSLVTEDLPKEIPESTFTIPVYSEELAEEQKSTELEDDDKKEEEPFPEKSLEEQPVEETNTFTTGIPRIPIISVTEYFEENEAKNPEMVEEFEDQAFVEDAEDQERSMGEEENWENSHENEIGGMDGQEEWKQLEDDEEKVNGTWGQSLEETQPADEADERPEVIHAPAGKFNVGWKQQPEEKTGRNDNQINRVLNEETPVVEERKTLASLVEVKEADGKTQPEEKTGHEDDLQDKDADEEEEEQPLPPQPTPRRSLETTDDLDQNGELKKGGTKEQEVQRQFLSDVAGSGVFSELPVTPALYYSDTPSPSSPLPKKQTDEFDPFAGFDYTRKTSNSNQPQSAQKPIEDSEPEKFHDDVRPVNTMQPEKNVAGRKVIDKTEETDEETSDEIKDHETMGVAEDVPVLVDGLNDVESMQGVEKTVIGIPLGQELIPVSNSSSPVEETVTGSGSEATEEAMPAVIGPVESKSVQGQVEEKSTSSRQEDPVKSEVHVVAMAAEVGPSETVEYAPIKIVKKTTYSVLEQNKVRSFTLCQSMPADPSASPVPSTSLPSSAPQPVARQPQNKQPVPVHKTSTIEVELAVVDEEFKEALDFLNDRPSVSSRTTNKVADVHVVTLSPTRDLEKKAVTAVPVYRKSRWYRRMFCCSS